MTKWSLTALSDGLLARALNASSHRSGRTVHGGHPHPLRQTVIALAGGQSLDEHGQTGEATVQVLRGRVRMAAGVVTSDGSAGDLLIVPDTGHTVVALEDAVLLLTVVQSAPTMPDGGMDVRRRHQRRRPPVAARGRTTERAVVTVDRETSP